MKTGTSASNKTNFVQNVTVCEKTVGRSIKNKSVAIRLKIIYFGRNREKNIQSLMLPVEKLKNKRVYHKEPRR